MPSRRRGKPAERIPRDKLVEMLQKQLRERPRTPQEERRIAQIVREDTERQKGPQRSKLVLLKRIAGKRDSVAVGRFQIPTKFPEGLTAEIMNPKSKHMERFGDTRSGSFRLKNFFLDVMVLKFIDERALGFGMQQGILKIPKGTPLIFVKFHKIKREKGGAEKISLNWAHGIYDTRGDLLAFVEQQPVHFSRKK